jgi:hypothetical protein
MVVRYVCLFNPKQSPSRLCRMIGCGQVTRVTLEVGSQGKLGGQAHVPDVEGIWFELARNVSFYVVFLFFKTLV